MTAQSEIKPRLEYAVVVTGGDILDGLYPDSHTHYLSRVFRPRGGRCVLSVTVDDRVGDLKEALRYALGRSKMVVVTGGLGPTPNDITRETISDFTNIPLREREEVLEAMERRFSQSRETMRANLRRQALVPEGGDILENGTGTAVGLVYYTTNATIVALPGPPRELQPMVTQQLVPFLEERYGLGRVGVSLTLRFVGLGQSQISQVLQDQVRLPPELIITSQFEAGRVDFTFSLPGETDTERQYLENLAETMRRHLGSNIYAEDESTLEEKIIDYFAGHGMSVALAEVGTGGHITDSLSQVQAVERVLVGSFVAPTQRRLNQLLQLAGDTEETPIPLGRIAVQIRSRVRSDAVLVLVCPTGEESNIVRALLLWADGGQRHMEFPWTDARPASLALLTTRVLEWLRGQARGEVAGN